MLSSISSSDLYQAAAGRWLRASLAAGLLAVGALAGVERFWRSHGHQPTVTDNQELWSYWRRRADAGRSTVALTGSSRMQLDVSTGELRRLLPGRRVVQLAIDDSHPVAVLRDLADDERFTGTAIVEISEFGLSAAAWASQQDWIEHSHERSQLERRLNARIAAALQDRLALLNPSVELLKVVRSRVVPRPWYLRTREDRSREAHYALADVARQRALREAWILETHRNLQAPPPDAWLTQALAVDSLARKITARGGKVAFVAFPSTGASWDANERIYPKARYWDRFAAAASSVTIHFRDVPSLAGFDCPDTSHLDAGDAARFTAALVAELARRGVL